MSTASYCETSNFPVANASDLNYGITVGSAVIMAVTSPITVLGNALVLLAIWRNQSLRSPSYFLLGMLSFEYFLSGLIFQPSYAVKELAMALKKQQPYASSKSSSVWFYIHLIFGGIGAFLMVTTVLTVTLMALERWMYMTRRRWINSSRMSKLFVALLIQPLSVIVFRSLQIVTGSFCYEVNTLVICQLLFCFTTTTLTYFQVLLIIRRHRRQIQGNVTSQNSFRQPSVNLAKYRKSVFTIFYILILFYLCYFPFAVIVTVLLFADVSAVLMTAYKVSVMLLIVSSMLNPCLYCWRIREIRNGVLMLLKKMRCKN